MADFQRSAVCRQQKYRISCLAELFIAEIEQHQGVREFKRNIAKT
jgi:hypothetical protein